MRAYAQTLYLSALGLAVTSCLVHKPVENPEPPIEVPVSFAAESGQAMSERWWETFDDGSLTALVERALSDGFRVQAAWARLRQARAVAEQAGAPRWPSVDLSATAGRTKQRTFQPSFGVGPDGMPDFTNVEVRPFVISLNNFRASIGASYELDIWRKIDSRAKAAFLDEGAARDDLEALAMSISAELAEAWFDVLLQRENRSLLEAQLETNDTFLELVTLRFKQGLGASAVDVYQARQQVVSTRARLALVGASERVAANRIAVLIGVVPGAAPIGETAGLPTLPPLPGAGVPADLLLRRPDVRAIRRRVEAADWRTAAAVADRLPSLSLSGSVFVSGRAVSDLWTSPLYNLASNLLAPLFDAGRRAAEADRSRGLRAELYANYAQTLLQAMAEVENALALEKAQAAQIVELEQQVELARAALGEARVRYREGLTDFLPVITELRVLQQAEQGLLAARRQLLSYRVQLCRALGGTWTSDLREASADDE